MREQPLVSVIVPVYKVEPYLNRCVQSIVDQTYTNLQIILVDDGSPDGCPQMCDEWAKKDSRICVIHKPNGGLSDARNAGMAAVEGEYIAFVDSDDWVSKTFIENLYQAAAQNDCEAVGCMVRYTKQETEPEPDSRSHVLRILDCRTAVGDLIDGRIYPAVWNKLYRRELIRDIPFAKGKCHEDEFWSYQVLGRISRYAEIDYVGYNYFQRAESIMGQRFSLKRLDVLEARENRQIFLQKHLPELADKGQISLYFTCIYCGQLALKQLRGAERRQAYSRLRETSRRWTLSKAQKKTLKFTHRVWALIAQYSLGLVCGLRNMLGVGR